MTGGPSSTSGRRSEGPSRPRPGRPIGGRVAVVYSGHYLVHLPCGLERLHPFDVHKYARIYRALLDAGLIGQEEVFVPQPITEAQALLVHTPALLESLRDPRAVAEYLEAPLVGACTRTAVEAGIVKPCRYACGGTVEAARQALACGIGINLAGGYHHAMPDAGEGFCLYNDLAIAVRVLQRERLIRRAALVDLDVHQGNGTAVIFAGDDDAFTFSMHEASIYPLPKAASDLDVELADGTGDQEYLALLGRHLPGVLERSDPDVVFLQAGCDTLAGDPLAGLEMTPAGIVQRDAMVIDECVRRGIPLAMTTGGGYISEAWSVQYASIRRTIEAYGARESRPDRGP